MGVKEIEQLTGVPWRSIRFYKEQGILGAQLEKEAVGEVYKIKVLRVLGLSLEEIQALQRGKLALVEVLEYHDNQGTLGRFPAVIRKMYRQGESYDSLDGAKYLGEMEGVLDQPVVLPKTDTMVAICAPRTRSMARALDFLVYGVGWIIFLSHGLDIYVNPKDGIWQYWEAILLCIFMLLFEPISLTLFGTTFGKWMLGLRVTNPDGGRLSYRQALGRTWRVFFGGLGALIPIYSLVCSFSSYQKCRKGLFLPWEKETVMTMKPYAKKRAMGYLGVWLGLSLVAIYAVLTAELPKYRGDLTVAQFCENYNNAIDFYEVPFANKLDETGNWLGAEKEIEQTYYVYEPPRISFVEENGVVQEVYFLGEMAAGEKLVLPSYQREMFLAMNAFVGAREESGLFQNQLHLVLEEMFQHRLMAFQYGLYGVVVESQVEGVTDTMRSLADMPLSKEGFYEGYQVSFSMKKQK